MDEKKIEGLLLKVEKYRGKRSQILSELGIPRSTYYKWLRVYREQGTKGLARGTVSRRIWNRLTPDEAERILEIAKHHPELTSRLLSIKITDEEEFSVSESTVYRVLKQHNLIAPRPFTEMPAAKEWKKKTKAPDELWQCDGTNLFVVGWGYYKLIPVEDDYSRKIIAYDLRPDETALSLSDTLELALEQARTEGHLLDRMPKLYSDNGSGFTSKLMDKYLSAHGIKYIFGTPYHPQGRGKIERFNRTIKEKLCLVVYCSPDELKRAIDEAIAVYNSTPHEALNTVSPDDVYAGRKETILRRREEKRRLTLQRRKQYNLRSINNSPNRAQSAK